MKGRSTTAVCIRLPDSVITTLKEQASRRGVSLGEFLKQKIEDYATRLPPAQGNIRSVITTKPDTTGQGSQLQTNAHSVITMAVSSELITHSKPYSKEQSLRKKHKM